MLTGATASRSHGLMTCPDINSNLLRKCIHAYSNVLWLLIFVYVTANRLITTPTYWTQKMCQKTSLFFTESSWIMLFLLTWIALSFYLSCLSFVLLYPPQYHSTFFKFTFVMFVVYISAMVLSGLDGREDSGAERWIAYSFIATPWDNELSRITKTISLS